MGTLPCIKCISVRLHIIACKLRRAQGVVFVSSGRGRRHPANGGAPHHTDTFRLNFPLGKERLHRAANPSAHVCKTADVRSPLVAVVAETVDQLRGSPSSASAPWTGGGKKQLAAIGVYGNGAYELTEVEVPGSSSNAASRNHRAVRVPPHRTRPGAAGAGWTTVKVMGPKKHLVGD